MEPKTLSAGSEKSDVKQKSDSQSRCLAVFLPLLIPNLSSSSEFDVLCVWSTLDGSDCRNSWQLAVGRWGSRQKGAHCTNTQTIA